MRQQTGPSHEGLFTHWGRVTHKCVSKLTTNSPDNGFSPGRCQGIIWTNADILPIGPLGTNFSQILVAIHTFTFKRMHLKISSGKWRPFCLGPSVLTKPICFWYHPTHTVQGVGINHWYYWTRQIPNILVQERWLNFMMTTSNGNNFHVTGPSCGKFTGHRRIPLTKASDPQLWGFSLICAWINRWVNNREAGDLGPCSLWRHCNVI